MYRIREVDGHDDEISDTLADLHRLTFFGGAPIPAFDQGNWWMVFHGTRAVAFARSCIVDARVQRGIFLPGRGAKKTLGPFAAITADARAGSSGQNGWCCILSDTTDNLASANNLIRAGYL